MKIIDCRYRPPTEPWLNGILHNPVYADYVEKNGFHKKKPEALKDCVEKLLAASIDKAVLVGRDIESTWHVPPDNSLVEADFAAFPDFFIPVRGVDPHKGIDSYRHIKKSLASGQIAGIAIEPGMCRCAVDDAHYYPYYALCCDAGAPVIITAGMAPRLRGVALDAAAPWRIDRVANDYPELRLLVSHGGYPYVCEALAVCARHDNIFMDLSTTFNKPLAVEYARAAAGSLADRFVFSSASPYADALTALSQAKTIPFNAESEKMFFETNALKLFKNWRRP